MARGGVYALEVDEDANNLSLVRELRKRRRRKVITRVTLLIAAALIVIIVVVAVGNGGDGGGKTTGYDENDDDDDNGGAIDDDDGEDETSQFQSMSLEVPIDALGTVIGTRNATSKLEYWLGIPYAIPPIGPLRWQPPQPLADGNMETTTTTTFNATSYKPCCMQAPPLGGGTRAPISEDCLHLNIFRPILQTTAETGERPLLPVLAYIHGGGYVDGCAVPYTRNGVDFESLDETDPAVHAPIVHASSSSADEHSDLGGGAILVTFNYRLNIFGFFCGDGVRKRTTDGSCGNFGVQDQQAALEWIRRNIARFGGDPERVTIFGESAGGNSVLQHLVRKPSFGLYRSAIIQSGTYSPTFVSEAKANEIYESILERTDSDRIGCTETCSPEEQFETLLALDAEKLLAISPVQLYDFDLLPVVDGVALLAPPEVLISAGDFNAEAPVIITSTRDEMANFLSIAPITVSGANISEDEFECILTRTCEANVKSFLWLLVDVDEVLGTFEEGDLKNIKDVYAPENGYPYPADYGDYSEWWWRLMRFSTDQVPGFGRCSSRWIGRLLASKSSAVWEAQFSHPTRSYMFEDSHFSAHGSDVAYLFSWDEYLQTEEEKALATSVQRYWVALAATGDPNIRDLPAWPQQDVSKDTLLSIGGEAEGGIQILREHRAQACDWHDQKAMERGLPVVGVPP